MLSNIETKRGIKRGERVWQVRRRRVRAGAQFNAGRWIVANLAAGSLRRLRLAAASSATLRCGVRCALSMTATRRGWRTAAPACLPPAAPRCRCRGGRQKMPSFFDCFLPPRESGCGQPLWVPCKALRESLPNRDALNAVGSHCTHTPPCCPCIGWYVQQAMHFPLFPPSLLTLPDPPLMASPPCGRASQQEWNSQSHRRSRAGCAAVCAWEKSLWDLYEGWLVREWGGSPTSWHMSRAPREICGARTDGRGSVRAMRG